MAKTPKTLVLSLFPLLFTPLQAEAMKWEDLPESPNIIDRRGQPRGADNSAEDPSNLNFAEQRGAFLEARKNLLAATELAERNDPVFSCELLKGHREALAKLGKALKTGGDPMALLPDAEVAGLEHLQGEIGKLDDQNICTQNVSVLREVIAMQSARYKKECADFSQAFQQPVADAQVLYVNLASDYRNSSGTKAWYEFWKTESDCTKSTNALLKAMADMSESAKKVCLSLLSSADRLDMMEGQIHALQNVCKESRSLSSRKKATKN